MKKLLFTSLLASTLIFTGCFKDDQTPIIIEEVTNNYYNDGGNGGGSSSNLVAVSGAITATTTWTSDKIYVLNQKVVVESYNFV